MHAVHRLDLIEASKPTQHTGVASDCIFVGLRFFSRHAAGFDHLLDLGCPLIGVFSMTVSGYGM